MIRYKDGAETVRHAADVISACGPRPDLVLKLRHLAIVLEAAAPVPVPPRAPLRAPATEYEAAHHLAAADALNTLTLQPVTEQGQAGVAVRHIVEAAAHRVMSQVIGAIEKVNAAPPVNVVGYDALREMARAAGAPPRGDRPRGKGAARVPRGVGLRGKKAARR
jgi:hypothetical protein